MSDNIKTYLKEMGCEDEDCIYLAQDRVTWRDLMNTVMNQVVVIWVVTLCSDHIITRCHNPEDQDLNLRRRENLMSLTVPIFEIP
jgi:hypothetical protein